MKTATLNDDIVLQIDGNKMRVNPGGVWHQFDVEKVDEIKVGIVMVNQFTVKLVYKDKEVIANINGTNITYAERQDDAL